MDDMAGFLKFKDLSCRRDYLLKIMMITPTKLILYACDVISGSLLVNVPNVLWHDMT